MTKTPDFDKAAKEKYPMYMDDYEIDKERRSFLAGCEHAYAILNQKCEEEKNEIANNANMYIKKLEKKIAELKHAYSIDKETIERLEKEKEALKKHQKLANDYILALNDYHESIHGRDIRCDQSLYNKAQKAGEDYADSLESGK